MGRAWIRQSPESGGEVSSRGIVYHLKYASPVSDLGSSQYLSCPHSFSCFLQIAFICTKQSLKFVCQAVERCGLHPLMLLNIQHVLIEHHEVYMSECLLNKDVFLSSSTDHISIPLIHHSSLQIFHSLRQALRTFFSTLLSKTD